MRHDTTPNQRGRLRTRRSSSPSPWSVTSLAIVSPGLPSQRLEKPRCRSTSGPPLLPARSRLDFDSLGNAHPAEGPLRRAMCRLGRPHVCWAETGLHPGRSPNLELNRSNDPGLRPNATVLELKTSRSGNGRVRDRAEAREQLTPSRPSRTRSHGSVHLRT